MLNLVFATIPLLSSLIFETDVRYSATVVRILPDLRIIATLKYGNADYIRCLKVHYSRADQRLFNRSSSPEAKLKQWMPPGSKFSFTSKPIAWSSPDFSIIAAADVRVRFYTHRVQPGSGQIFSEEKLGTLSEFAKSISDNRKLLHDLGASPVFNRTKRGWGRATSIHVSTVTLIEQPLIINKRDSPLHEGGGCLEQAQAQLVRYVKRT